MAPASSSWKSMLGVGVLVAGIIAAVYPVVIVPMMNPVERDEVVRDPRMTSGFEKKSMWKVSTIRRSAMP